MDGCISWIRSPDISSRTDYLNWETIVTSHKAGDAKRKVTPPGPGEVKQTNEPWEQPVEKEQDPGKLSPEDLERWQRTNTH